MLQHLQLQLLTNLHNRKSLIPLRDNDIIELKIRKKN